MTTRATPNGLCWCDCGGTTKPGNFFLQGHDKRAERYLTAIEGGLSIADRLAGHGYVPTQAMSLRDDTLKADPSYEECGRYTLDGEPCRVIGKPQGMRKHRAADDRHLPDDQ